VTAHREEAHDAIERQLRESEERFRCAFEDAGLGMALVTREGRNLRVNRALTTILGYSEEELLRITWKDVVHPDDLDASLQNWDGFDAGAFRAITSQKRYFHKDGHLLWVEVTLSMIRNDADEPACFLAQVRDISRERALTDALRASEELARAAFMASVVGLALLTPTGEMVAVNPALAEMLGLDLDEATAAHWSALIHPDDREAAGENFASVARGLVPSARAHRRYRHADGHYIDVAITLSAVPAVDGSVRSLFVQIEDVTEELRRERERTAAIDRLALVLDAVQDGVWDWEIEAGRAFYSPQWFGILGYPPEGRWEDAGLFPTLIHQDDRERVLAANERQINDPDAGAYDERFRMRRADGSWAWVRSRGRVIDRDPAGRAIRMVGTHTDITAEIETTEARRRSEERYALVIEALEDGVWDHDLVHNTGQVSPRYLGMLGYPPRAEITYDDFLALVHPDDLAEVHATTTRPIHDPEATAYDMEFRMRRTDGTWARIRCRGRVVERDPEGRATRAIGTHTDVTERRQLEEQYRHTQKMEAIGKLAGGVAHDFNNLLTTISATTTVLHEELATDDPHRADLDQIARAADRAKALTGQLLAFSRLEVERRQHLAIDQAVRQVEPLLRRLLAPGQALEVALDAHDAVVSLDPAQLELTLLNLVANARDAMPDGGMITIRTATTSRTEVTLVVADTGVGMEPAIAERAFEPFFTTKPQGKGTGLGLATVYGFAERLGGGVVLATTPRLGTVVTLTLPIAQDVERATPPVPPLAAAVPQHAGKRILVVDDEEGVRRSTRRLLERRGYTVLEADSAAQAHLILTEATVDVMLTDHAMPGGTGRELAREVMERHPKVRVVLMSGFAGEGEVRDEIRGRAVPFLAKPFTLDELVMILDATG
jgi:PAS domain S-box-containing protein